MGLHSPLLWQKAHDALNSKNKAVIPPDFATQPEGMMVEIEKRVSQSQGKPIRLPNGESLFVRDVLGKISRWIKKFVEVGDAAVQYDPGHAALPWALLRLLLQASLNNTEKHAAVLEGIEKIAYYLVWSRIEEAFLAIPFEAHAQLQLDFVQLYTAILTFVTRSIRFLNDKPQRIATAFTSSDSKFRKDMEQMAARRLSIESHVQQLMHQSSLEQWGQVKRQLADLHQPLIRIEQRFESTSAIIDRAETERILDWASEIPFEKHFRTVQQKALDGTGKWLFEDPEFVAWETCSRSQILWLHGSAGSGKSTLMSLVIRSLMRVHEEQQGPYPVYFFCSRNTAEPERADPEHILRSLMRQASDLPGGPPLHRVLKDRYDKRRVKGNVSAEEASEIFLSAIETRPATYIVVDALDECDRQKRDILLDALKTILTRSDSLVKVLVTSRDSHYDITLSMDGSPAVCIDASRNREDIDYYVQHSVQRAIDRRKLLPTERMTDDLQQAIVNSLCSGADGIFRWVELQLELLYTFRVRSILLERLAGLPPRLEEIYDELYNYKMQELGKEQAEVAKTILSLLLVVKVPLHTSEVCQLVCTSEEADMSIETVLDITFDLVRLDTEQDQFKFSHFSVREFLERRQAGYGQISLQTMATRTCLNFLAGSKTVDAGSYAALYWPFHAEDATREGGGPKIEQQLDTFLTEHNSCFRSWNDSMLKALRQTSDKRLSPTERRLSQALKHLRGVAILYQLIRINLRNRFGESALQLASQYGPVESVRALLGRGADTNTEGGEHGNALCAASLKGHAEIVKLLLDNGADVNAIGVIYECDSCRCTTTALYSAASKGHADIVELLLCNGASVNTQVVGLDEFGDKSINTALHAASIEGFEEIVKLLLLNKDIDVNLRGGMYDMALCAASFTGHLGIVKLLLDKRADVNAVFPDRLSLTALCAASLRGHIEVAKLLLHRGADVNTERGPIGNSLCAALQGGCLELVNLLIDEGADVNAQGRWDGNALTLASARGSLDTVVLLLESGANASASGDALCAASSGGHTDIVKLLLHRGIGVNARGSTYQGTALCFAIHSGLLEPVNLLLDERADVNARGGDYGSPLCTAIHGSLLMDKRWDFLSPKNNLRNYHRTASSGRYLEIIDLLLGNGVDINAQGCGLGTALQAVSFAGRPEIAKLLIDRGADVNAQGGKCGNALQAASYRGHADIARLLLEHGANVNAWEALPAVTQRNATFNGAFHFSGDSLTDSDDTSTALYAATLEGHKEIVELLLNNNANVNPEADALLRDQCNIGETITDTALHAAASRGSTDIVKLLLSKGVDVNRPGGFQNGYSCPLQAALYGAHQEVACLLLEAGADVNAQGQDVEVKTRTMLQIAASRGYAQIVDMLLMRGAIINKQEFRDDNLPQSADGSALQVASLGGHREVVGMLLDAGAKFNIKAGELDDALQATSANGHAEITKLLLDQGANSDGALRVASANGHLEIAKLLLDQGADVGGALQAALAGGNRDVVELLLDKGAKTNMKGESGDSALHAACASETEWPDVVEILLHAGADVNAQGHTQSLPLQLASARGHEEVVRLLLNAGADINAWRDEENEYCGEGGECQDNALCAASYEGHWEVIKMLLDAGATDINWDGERYSGALVAASSQGHVEIVRLLLDMGADVNSQEGDSFQAALFEGHRDVAKLLFKTGADVDAQSWCYGNALQAACSSRREQPETVKMLLDAGADVNAQGEYYGNALQHACSSGREQPEVIKMVLDAGANVNAQGGWSGNALQSVCVWGIEQPEVVRMLLDAGADVNAQGGYCSNALQAACRPLSKVQPDIVKMLLDAGANVNAQGGLYHNALQAACSSRREQPEIVKMLLDAGADVNAQGGEYGNALQAASCLGHTEVAKLLRSAGAQHLGK